MSTNETTTQNVSVEQLPDRERRVLNVARIYTDETGPHFKAKILAPMVSDLTKRQVGMALAKLEERGIIEIANPGNGGRNYRLSGDLNE